MKTNALLLLMILWCSTALCQSGDSVITRKKYVTQRLQGTITLDGAPDEEAWNAVPWEGGFTQYQPGEGNPPTQETAFKILYDNKFLYIAYRCFDSAPDSIIRRMSRRDEFPGDWMEVNIDSYHDQRTAFSFTLSVSGVRGDEFVSNDGRNWDVSWNPIWYGKTKVDDKGWTAEVKIPLSQLRYGNEKDKVWGLQVHRRLFRREERSTWVLIPQTTGVWTSQFGELHGLKDIPTHRQVEIAPYVTVQTDVYKEQEGNPFATGFDKRLTAGVDGKYAVTNDLILDFTINPDFGQVEADPSQVRIDGFQNFFEERRPFFIESRNIFDYRLTGSQTGGEFDSDLLFYSRRIGSSPHGFPALDVGEHVKYPQNTSILGAAKFSGKTRDGWSIGLLESVTEREMATIDKSGQRRDELVEPLTSYMVARLQKDIRAGNTVLGGIFTAVNREKGLEFLHRSAYSGGLDFLHFWRNRSWYIRGNVVFSNVNGSREAILATQTSFEHLFQRPGAREVSVDSNRTSLSGTGATIRFGKSSGKRGRKGQVLQFETGVTWRSPGLELNDIGFMLAANEINHFTWAGMMYPKSFAFFRNARINYNHWLRWDFSGKFLYSAFNTNTHAVFSNNWSAGAGMTWNPFDISNNALRGASDIRRPAYIGFNNYLNSDSRKKLYAGVSYSRGWGFDSAIRIQNFNLSLTFQPLDALRISIAGNYGTYFRRQDQFVRNINHNNTTRTIVGQVFQKTIRFTGRVNFNITPDLTLQYYGQPFITRPLYSQLAYVSDPLHKKYDARFTVFAPNQLTRTDNVYAIDEDSDGVVDYSFSAPDFNFVQFRSNFIVRWEYRPGSELYFVWSQSNTADAFNELDSPLFNSLVDNAFAEHARNIFLVKWTYRFLK